MNPTVTSIATRRPVSAIGAISGIALFPLMGWLTARGLFLENRMGFHLGARGILPLLLILCLAASVFAATRWPRWGLGAGICLVSVIALAQLAAATGWSYAIGSVVGEIISAGANGAVTVLWSLCLVAASLGTLVRERR